MALQKPTGLKSTWPSSNQFTNPSKPLETQENSQTARSKTQIPTYVRRLGYFLDQMN